MLSVRTIDQGIPGRHVVITGSAAPELDGLADDLRAVGVVVSLAANPSDLALLPVTAIVVAESLRSGMDWETWWEEERHTWGTFESILPQLTAPSTGVLVGLTSTDALRARAAMRKGIRQLISRYEATAAMQRGVEFTMNAIEVPPGGDRELLRSRLGEFLVRRKTLANSVVIPLEALRSIDFVGATASDVI